MADVRAAVAEREKAMDERQANARRYIESLAPQIARVLPKHIPEDRIIRIAITAMRKTPELTFCTPLSLAGALLTASALGLEVNTPMEEAFLVPYADEATLIIGYQGFCKLGFQTGLVKRFEAEAVYPEDRFDWAKGTSAFLDWKRGNRAENSQPTHYYALAELSSGACPFEVLTAEEVRRLRGGIVGPRSPKAPPDPQRWLERKTPLRQLVKLLPKDPLLMMAATVDETGGTKLYRDRVVSTRADLTEEETAALDAVPAQPDTEPGIVEDPPPGGEDL